MKQKYIAPTITIVPMEEVNLLATSNTPHTGMDIPTESEQGVEGDAKEGFFDFEGFYLEDVKEP